MKILLVNDDGKESPALLPTILELKKIGTVTTIVPKAEQSWTSKANQRRAEKIELLEFSKQGEKIIAIDGYPADCTNFGIHLSDPHPDIVVSGANVGHNLGMHSFLSSGTIGAALEGLIEGIPSVAISIPYSRYPPPNIEQPYQEALMGVAELIHYFYTTRPKQFMLMSINTPLSFKSSKFAATTVQKFSYGALFKRQDDHVVPRNYGELYFPGPEDYQPNSDVEIVKNGGRSVVILDDMANFVPVQEVSSWLANFESND